MATFQVSDSDSSASKIDHDGTSVTRKQITVTFEDVGIEVFGAGQDYGSNCLSVLGDLVPTFGQNNRPKRVSAPAIITSQQQTLTYSSTSFKV